MNFTPAHSALWAGHLFPDTILTSTAFIAFTLFVGFNTIIYLGLTAARFVRWPAQVPPERLRQLLPFTPPKEATVSGLAPSQRQLIAEPIQFNRRAAAQTSLPLGFGLAGTILVIVSLLSMLLNLPLSPAAHIPALVVGVLMVGISQVAARQRFSAAALSWTWAAMAILAVAAFCLQFLLQEQLISLAYAIAITALIAPVATYWRPAIAGGLLSLTLIISTCLAESPVDYLPWVLAASVAFGLSTVLLRLRLANIDTLTLEQLRANALATTDAQTGVLSRHGLLSMADAVAGSADRMDREVCLVLVQIHDLEQLNARYGVEYGDRVVKTIARGLTSVVREGDLVGRWSGRRFAVLGVGERPDAAAFSMRVADAVAASGLALGKNPIEVRTGSAASAPRETSLFTLYDAAAENLAARQVE